jgi:FkbM family methyltransferase
MSAISSLRMHYRLFGVPGILKRARAGIKGGHPELLTKLPNRQGAAYVRIHTTDVLVFEHVFAGGGYDFKLKFSPKVIVDIGANIGLASVLFATRYPDARIISIEPEPSNFAVLAMNAKLFPQIEPVHAAVWNRSDVAYIDPEIPYGHCGVQVSKNLENGISVKCLTVSELIDRFNLPQIDIMKIDAEGAECEILENASAWMDNVNLICAELHERFRPGCHEAFARATVGFLRGWRYDELCCVDRMAAEV